MHGLSKIRNLSLSLLAAATLTTACGSSSNNTPDTGTGGSKVDGGGTGGIGIDAGAGGAVGTGGVGIDASTGTTDIDGSVLATGGAVGTGGVAIDGGPKATGGAVGAGGAIIDGGPKATGGSTAVAGASGHGGATSAGGTKGSGGATGAGGVMLDGGDLDGGTSDDGGTVDDVPQGSDFGGTVNGSTVTCKPRTSVINDFSNADCSHGDYNSGEMVSGADVTPPAGTSNITATCGSAGGWVFSGTLGVATDDNANDVGFALSFDGNVMQNGLDGSLTCNNFDLSDYAGLSITLSSASGSVTSIAVAAEVSGNRQPDVTIQVPRTPTAVHVTWAQLGITAADAAKITGLPMRFVNGTSAITVDLAIKSIGLF